MKKIICVLLIMLLLCGCAAPQASSGIKIVAVNFPAFDFARAVAGGNAQVSMLLPPGSELHSFEPSPEDIIKIEQADIIIYTGGESDGWIDKILSSVGGDKEVISMMDCSSLICDEHHDHHDGDHHHADEHVWLSPDNAVSVIGAIADALCKTDGKHSAEYKQGAADYSDKIKAIAEQTKKTIENADTKHLVVADRFPLIYFCQYYSLDYTAAFAACDSFADADAKTVINLISAIEDNNLGAVFYIENGSGYLADTVCEETGAMKLRLHTMHTVSAEEFKKGVTYLDICEGNRLALERGLKRAAD